jgi:hypothetical protein
MARLYGVALVAVAVAIPVAGTPRADRIDVVGGGRHSVNCGRGVDVVTADAADRVAADCEIVSRRISVDTLRAAAAIGWAASPDAGRTWRAGLLPGLGGNATDPVVAHDAAHRTWLVSTLILGSDFTAIGISRSPDGFTWSAPVRAVELPFASISYDKEWIACDDVPTSPFYGRCYLVYDELKQFGSRLAIQVSQDGGAVWSEPADATTAFGAGAVGALPLVRPDGSLTVVFAAKDAVRAMVSTDGGATFGAPVQIAPLHAFAYPGLRTPALPTAAVDTSGRIIVAWTDCGLRSSCTGNDVVMSTSADGAVWSPPVRVVSLDSFAPDIAADRAIPGRLALVTYVRDRAMLGVAVTSSRNGGLSWSRPQRLDARPMRPAWLAESSGRFVGDYVGSAFSGGRFVAVFPLAEPPTRGLLHEAMFAASLP